jgi:hypothetical protein
VTLRGEARRVAEKVSRPAQPDRRPSAPAVQLCTHDVAERLEDERLDDEMCHRGTGNECFIMKVAVGSIPELENLIDEFTQFGQVTTSIVLSSPIPGRPLSVRGPVRSRRRR